MKKNKEDIEKLLHSDESLPSILKEITIQEAGTNRIRSVKHVRSKDLHYWQAAGSFYKPVSQIIEIKE